MFDHTKSLYDNDPYIKWMNMHHYGADMQCSIFPQFMHPWNKCRHFADDLFKCKGMLPWYVAINGAYPLTEPMTTYSVDAYIFCRVLLSRFIMWRKRSCHFPRQYESHIQIVGIKQSYYLNNQLIHDDSMHTRGRSICCRPNQRHWINQEE